MGFACPHTEALPPRGPLTCLWPQPPLFQQERSQSLSISSSYQEPVPVRRPTQLLGSDLVPPNIPWRVVQSPSLLAQLPWTPQVECLAVSATGLLNYTKRKDLMGHVGKVYLPAGMALLCLESLFYHGVEGSRAWREAFHILLPPKNPVGGGGCQLGHSGQDTGKGF